jgi:hypothetical protein
MITVCFGVIAILFMAHTPAQAKFLSDEERVVALRRMKQDAHGATTEEDVGQERFNWHWIRMALLSPNTWFCSLAWFFLLIPLYVGSSRGPLGQVLTTLQSFSLFLPTIIKALGYTATTAQLFTVSTQGFACRVSNV